MMNSKEIVDYINKLMNYTYTQLEIEKYKYLKLIKKVDTHCERMFLQEHLEIIVDIIIIHRNEKRKEWLTNDK